MEAIVKERWKHETHAPKNGVIAFARVAQSKPYGNNEDRIYTHTELPAVGLTQKTPD